MYLGFCCKRHRARPELIRSQNRIYMRGPAFHFRKLFCHRINGAFSAFHVCHTATRFTVAMHRSRMKSDDNIQIEFIQEWDLKNINRACGRYFNAFSCLRRIQKGHFRIGFSCECVDNAPTGGKRAFRVSDAPPVIARIAYLLFILLDWMVLLRQLANHIFEQRTCVTSVHIISAIISFVYFSLVITLASPFTHSQRRPIFRESTIFVKAKHKKCPAYRRRRRRSQQNNRCVFVIFMKRLPVELLLSFKHIYSAALTIHSVYRSMFERAHKQK